VRDNNLRKENRKDVVVDSFEHTTPPSRSKNRTRNKKG
jgi:hypothetical protein